MNPDEHAHSTPGPNGVQEKSAAYWEARFEEERKYSRQWEQRAKSNYRRLGHALQQIEQLKTIVRTLL